MVDRVLLTLLDCAGDSGLAVLATNLVADRLGIPLSALIHTIPSLYDRGWLDQRCPAGTLKLSESGLEAARALRRA